MTTEVYKYIGRDRVAHESIDPGKYRTIVNVNSKGEEEVIVVQCSKDDKLTSIHTIHPLQMIDFVTEKVAVYDRGMSENLPLIVRRGERETIYTSEKIAGIPVLLTVRYRIAHK